ncbi:Ent-kaurene oxidase [Tolypocladium paradoxum]|uniref:Ent-kaurene oxidase n=1 Tax=Tolypocladium paradoxum TaxID=94208 RepID=A0A2S4KTD8_9HYPO|nr:Ent-kaurene oxidase [Tolypocladium paradoxum]
MENASSITPLQPGIDIPPPRSVFGARLLTYYLAISAALVVAWLIQAKKQRSTLPVPLYKAPKAKWIFCAETLVKDSYRKFQDKVYQIRGTEGPQLVLPSNYVGELKTLPEDVLSAKEAIADALQSKYTKFSPGRNAELLTLLLRTRLTQNLVKLAPQLKEELEHIVATEFPACDDWTPVTWHPFALRAITRLSGRAFVGPEINRREQWIDTSINFAIHVFMAGAKLQLFPEWARPLTQYLVTDLGKIRRDIESAKAMIRPVLEERIRDLDSPSCGEPPNDMIQWLIEALPDDEKADVQTQAELQLIIAAASIHTTHGLLCECMYDLAAHQDIQEELREEAYQVLEVDEGWGRKESMTGLKKMDSFMREVQRLRGNIVSFLRKVMQPISLSDGTQLPVGTRIVAPLAGIAHDERFFPDPDRFDPLRFYRLRQESAEANNRLQFTSIGDTYVNFGAGRHACPGRFFASNEIKLVLARFVLDYDIRLRQGEERPKPMSIVMTKSPSPNAVLEFRRRS